MGLRSLLQRARGGGGSSSGSAEGLTILGGSGLLFGASGSNIAKAVELVRTGAVRIWSPNAKDGPPVIGCLEGTFRIGGARITGAGGVQRLKLEGEIESSVTTLVIYSNFNMDPGGHMAALHAAEPIGGVASPQSLIIPASTFTGYEDEMSAWRREPPKTQRRRLAGLWSVPSVAGPAGLTYDIDVLALTWHERNFA